MSSQKQPADAGPTSNQLSRSRNWRQHQLLRVAEWVPGREPTDSYVELPDPQVREYRTSYWRCEKCGQERNDVEDFIESCTIESSTDAVTDGGYSIDDPRTRRAITEAIDVRFGTCGPQYVVHSESGNTYVVDIAARSCSCPDYEKRDPVNGCKHIRRVDMEIRAAKTPRPDGRFVRPGTIVRK